MNKIIDIQGYINKMRLNSQQFRDQIMTIKNEDVSMDFYLNNLKKLSLQALDLYSAMNKQVCFLNNQKRLLAVRQNAKNPMRRRKNELSLE